MASKFKFQRHGQSGMELSEMLPHLGSCADDLCLVRSMHTDAFNHHPGQLQLFTGTSQFGRPTMGAWTVYGLGSESQNLPGFVVLTSGVGTSGGASNFSSGFLPSHYQGTVFRNSGDPILYLSNPPGVGRESQKATLNAIRDLNEEHYASTGDLEIASRISSYELAFRMQSDGPDLLSFKDEPQSILEMYGVNSDEEDLKQYATNCLLARRMIERGVRFILMMDASWDDHTELNKKLPKRCRKIDQPTAALIKDLKQRGLLDETLLVWGGEFGRTPMAQGNGRDHHIKGFSMWMAGGGIKGGITYGATDDMGYNAVENAVHIHDFHATMLHLLGIDHTKLTHRFQGRDFRLTDVAGRIVKDILA
jgi:arylsulfatase A-like enzyme